MTCVHLGQENKNIAAVCMSSFYECNLSVIPPSTLHNCILDRCQLAFVFVACRCPLIRTVYPNFLILTFFPLRNPKYYLLHLPNVPPSSPKVLPPCTCTCVSIESSSSGTAESSRCGCVCALVVLVHHPTKTKPMQSQGVAYEIHQTSRRLKQTSNSGTPQNASGKQNTTYQNAGGTEYGTPHNRLL